MQDRSTQVVVTGVGHWRGEGMALVEAGAAEGERVWRPRANSRAGRSRVTGIGVVTSLGAGKADNWTQADRRASPASAASPASRPTG